MPFKKGDKIVIGMSGGVDSSMGLVLLKKRGFKPIGLSLKYTVWLDKKNLLRENICCSKESFEIAKNVCNKLDTPHYIVNVAKEFKKKVIDYFLSELKNNKTPNPCIFCNPYLKFKSLFKYAKKHNIKYVATGHYARIRKNLKTNRYELLTAKDRDKDQTYSLSFLTQKLLKYTIFPLGDYTKTEVYQMAKKQGFEFFLKKKQSQDFCFVANRSIKYFLEKEIGKKQGLIKDIKGKILGKHQGLHFYTIGQRKGINLSDGPYFARNFDISNNFLIVTKNEKDLYQKGILLYPCNFISGIYPKNKILIQAKVRSHQKLFKAKLFPISKNRIKLVFNKPQKGITPGQFAVFYQKNVCLGGGCIL